MGSAWVYPDHGQYMLFRVKVTCAPCCTACIWAHGVMGMQQMQSLHADGVEKAICK